MDRQLGSFVSYFWHRTKIKDLALLTSGRKLLGVDDFGSILLTRGDLHASSDHREGTSAFQIEQLTVSGCLDCTKWSSLGYCIYCWWREMSCFCKVCKIFILLFLQAICKSLKLENGKFWNNIFSIIWQPGRLSKCSSLYFKWNLSVSKRECLIRSNPFLATCQLKKRSE